jgi:hypothetical protein
MAASCAMIALGVGLDRLLDKFPRLRVHQPPDELLNDESRLAHSA